MAGSEKQLFEYNSVTTTSALSNLDEPRPINLQMSIYKNGMSKLKNETPKANKFE